MEMTITRQFTILSLHPEKGRIIVPFTRFRYTLTGAFLMDFYLRKEISVSNKRVIPSIRNNGDPLHDRLCDIIGSASGPRKISAWIRRLSFRGRRNFRDSVSLLVSNGTVTHQKRYFLGIIPYNRYYFTDPGTRKRIIDNLRNVVISGNAPTDEQIMLLGLLKVSRSLRRLAFDSAEKSLIRARCREILKKDENSSETTRFVQMVISAVTIAIAATEASYRV